jgi:hypothetical protein
MVISLSTSTSFHQITAGASRHAYIKIGALWLSSSSAQNLVDKRARFEMELHRVDTELSTT